MLQGLLLLQEYKGQLKQEKTISAKNDCVGEQCDNRGCDCDKDSYSHLEQTMYMYKY